jgi:hypothetical protein
MRHTLTVIVLLLLPLSGNAAENDAFKRVASARYFAFGGIGIVGTTSDEEIGFRAILASKTAGADFARLLKVGNAEGKCYALVGLRLIDRAAFEEQAKAVLDAHVEIETVSGCNVMKQPMSAVVTSIRAGNYDLQARRELKR